MSQIKERHTKKTLTEYKKRLEKTRLASKEYNENASKGKYKTIYKFNNDVLVGIDDLEVTTEKIKLKGYKKEIDLKS